MSFQQTHFHIYIYMCVCVCVCNLNLNFHPKNSSTHIFHFIHFTNEYSPTLYHYYNLSLYIYIYTHDIPLQLAHDLNFQQTYLMALVGNLREAQSAKGPTTTSIATTNSENIVYQKDYPDFYFCVTKSEHKTGLKEKLEHICKHSQTLFFFFGNI